MTTRDRVKPGELGRPEGIRLFQAQTSATDQHVEVQRKNIGHPWPAFEMKRRGTDRFWRRTRRQRPVQCRLNRGDLLWIESPRSSSSASGRRRPAPRPPPTGSLRRSIALPSPVGWPRTSRSDRRRRAGASTTPGEKRSAARDRGRVGADWAQRLRPSGPSVATFTGESVASAALKWRSSGSSPRSS